MSTWTPELGPSATRLDELFEREYLPDAEQRANVFGSAASILARGPARLEDGSATGVALGFVQSGKTMSFTALAALAADNGYQLVIALLGSTDLLLEQNNARLVADLELQQRRDYRWVHLHKPPDNAATAGSIDRYLGQGKTVLITILKNASQVGRTARLLERTSAPSTAMTLVIDDEADQVSLNTKVRRNEESRTYEEIARLRRAVGPFLYAQYTATPFAPLLLEARDMLAPDFVELLEPGPDYTGGEAFFIEARDTVVRSISEIEAADTNPRSVPDGLRSALASFFAGAAIARAAGLIDGPISMLVHPSHLTVVHSHYVDMVEAQVCAWAQRVQRDDADPGRAQVLAALDRARRDLVQHGAEEIDDVLFEEELVDVLLQAEIWMVNSRSDIEAIDWHRSPVHILIGGNKLDRGFTVRGLTVTYMTRRAQGGQADTVEQRARAFGYKRPYLHLCRFFAPDNVVETFTSLVHTEDDMRSSLVEWMEAGEPLNRWAEEVGLVLPADVRPTRSTVIFEPSVFTGVGWHTLRRPDRSSGSVHWNRQLTEPIGVLDAPLEQFGSIEHRVLRDVSPELIIATIRDWRVAASPGWRHREIIDYLQRRDDAGELAPGSIVLLENEEEGTRVPRIRRWDPITGIPNLMQGSDPRTGYPGDRSIHGDQLQLQIHRLNIRDSDEPELLSLALYVPDLGSFGSTVKRRA